MKLKIQSTNEFDIKTLELKVKPRYWEDTTVNGIDDTENGDLIPCKQNIKDEKYWCPIIDMDSGIITNWPKGTTAEIHYKVADDGSYYLKDDAGNIILELEDVNVPGILCPKENGYGDYIIMDILENGEIDNWDPNLYEDFINNED